MEQQNNNKVKNPKQETLIKFIKAAKDGSYSELSKTNLNPNCSRITVLRQQQRDNKFYYFSIN